MGKLLGYKNSMLPLFDQKLDNNNLWYVEKINHKEGLIYKHPF